ncbi:MAG: hypothetical protein ABFC65_00080 [Rectinema sp.]
MHEPTKILDRPPETHKNAEKNPRRRGGWIAAALLILLVFAGCDNTFSVFQTIAKEERQIGEDLFKNTTVRAMADDSANYYALLSKVVWRPKSGGSWNVLAIDGSTDYFAAGLAGNGTKLYVAKADDNNGLEDIYTTSDSGTTWTAMSAAAGIGTDSFVDWLKCANDTLFVAVHDSTGKYSLFYYDGVSSKFASAGVSGIDEALVDIVYDGSQYWLISDSKVYKGTTPGSIAEDATAPNNPNYDGYLLGIASDGAGRIIVSRRDGSVYSYSSGAWSPIKVKSSTKLGPLFFLALPASSKRILIGKGVSSFGYMEYDESSSTPLKENGSSFVSTSSSIYYTTIHSKEVQAFWQPSSDPNTLFVLLASGNTGTYALYRNDYITGSWGGWTAE